MVENGSLISDSQVTRKGLLLEEGDIFGESRNHRRLLQLKQPFVMVIKLHIRELQKLTAPLSFPSLALPLPSAKNNDRVNTDSRTGAFNYSLHC